MKNIILFLFLIGTMVVSAQSQVAVKVRLYKAEHTHVLGVQLNNEVVEKLGQNIYKNYDLKIGDRLTFYIDDELVESLHVTQNILDRKVLNVLLTETTVLDELEIEYTNLNARLGFGTNKKYTRAERAVKRDKELSDGKTSAAHVKLDGLVNKLTGRAKLNKKVLSMEYEIQAMEHFLEVYSADFLYENYKLPKDKAPYFALHMIDFMNEHTDLNSDGFRMLMEEQLFNFKYD